MPSPWYIILPWLTPMSQSMNRRNLLVSTRNSVLNMSSSATNSTPKLDTKHNSLLMSATHVQDIEDDKINEDTLIPHEGIQPQLQSGSVDQITVRNENQEERRKRQDEDDKNDDTLQHVPVEARKVVSTVTSESVNVVATNTKRQLPETHSNPQFQPPDLADVLTTLKSLPNTIAYRHSNAVYVPPSTNEHEQERQHERKRNYKDENKEGENKKYPSRAKALIAAVMDATTISNPVARMNPTIHVRIPRHILRNTPVAGTPRSISSKTYTTVTVEGTQSSRSGSLFYSPFRYPKQHENYPSASRPRKVSFVDVNIQSEDVVRINDHFNISFTGFCGISGSHRQNHHFYGQDVLLYSGKCHPNGAGTVHFNSADEDFHVGDNGFTKHDFIPIRSSSSHVALSSRDIKSCGLVDFSFNLLQFDSRSLYDIHLEENAEQTENDDETKKRRKSKTKHVVTADLSFRLSPETDGDLLPHHHGDILLRYGYYFFLANEVDVTMYAHTAGVAQMMRLLMRRNPFKPKMAKKGEHEFFPLTDVPYVVVKVTAADQSHWRLGSITRAEQAKKTEHCKKCLELISSHGQ